MKKAICLILIAAVCISICACGGNQHDNQPTNMQTPGGSQPTQNDSTKPDESKPTQTDPSQPVDPPKNAFAIDKLNIFSSDRAWITFVENEIEYSGIIDKKGNVIAKFKTNSSIYCEAFVDGYAVIHDYPNKKAHIIDTTGKITYTAQGGLAVDHVKAGYFYSVEDQSDFYEKKFIYTIHQYDGKTIEEFTSDKDHKVQNLGKGIFYFSDKGFYCAKTDKWVGEKYINDNYSITWNLNEFEFEDESAILVGTIHDNKATDDNDPEVYIFIHPDGTIVELTEPKEIAYFSADRFSPVINDIVCYGDAGADIFVTVNIRTKATYYMESQYASKIRNDYAPTPSNGRVLYELRGADGADYLFCFDTEMNCVYGPKDCMLSNVYYVGDRFVYGRSTQNQVVLDKNGNIVFSLGDLGYSTLFVNSYINHYSSGMLLVSNSKYESVYIDVDGNILDKFSTEHSMEIILN